MENWHVNISVIKGSSYYDNVRPLSYPDADAVLICFDISRPETLDNVLKKVSVRVVLHVVVKDVPSCGLLPCHVGSCRDPSWVCFTPYIVMNLHAFLSPAI